ncbi:hypothetical protein F4780DRAFT_704035 [Xylariomycetidae sp. FL0641]|nr:hypothetical protein F4780DRAFT_704035 [Xylariomycetidae sp. FL0641]
MASPRAAETPSYPSYPSVPLRPRPPPPPPPLLLPRLRRLPSSFHPYLWTPAMLFFAAPPFGRQPTTGPVEGITFFCTWKLGVVEPPHTANNKAPGRAEPGYGCGTRRSGIERERASHGSPSPSLLNENWEHVGRRAVSSSSRSSRSLPDLSCWPVESTIGAQWLAR